MMIFKAWYYQSCNYNSKGIPVALASNRKAIIDITVKYIKSRALKPKLLEKIETNSTIEVRFKECSIDGKSYISTIKIEKITVIADVDSYPLKEESL